MHTAQMILTNTPSQAESRLHSQEQAEEGIVNVNKTELRCVFFKKDQANSYFLK